MEEDQVPPGFRFYPTEEELVSFYLMQKLQGTRRDLDCVIPLLDVYDYNPSDLPQLAGKLCEGDPEQWFFFTPRKEQEARGRRPCQLTDSGYWNATGTPGFVYSSGDDHNRVIGQKKTMVFYRGRSPCGRKTIWNINMYKAIDESEASSTSTVPKRAFDRRPSTGFVISKGMDQVQAQHEYDTSDASHQMLPSQERNLLTRSEVLSRRACF